MDFLFMGAAALMMVATVGLVLVCERLGAKP